MITSERKFVFSDISIDNITVKDASAKIFDMVKKREKGFVVTPNAAHFLYLRDDTDFRSAYKRASLILPDGYSLVLASRLLGTPLKGRCTGVDLFKEICNRLRIGKQRIFLLGGTDGSEAKAREKILSSNRYLSVGTYSPPHGFENDHIEINNIIRTVNSFEPDILFVFLGSPKSEKFISNNMDSLNVSVALSLGAALDYFSGKKRQAPEWIRNAGFEWFFRLLKEPIRLGKRYLIGNTYFIYLTLKQLLFRRS